MKCTRVVYPKANRAELESFELPDEPEPGKVLTRTDCSLISPGTERAWLAGKPNTVRSYPHHPGYGAASTVLAVGAGIEDLRPGDRVVGGNHASHQYRQAGSFTRIDHPDIDPAHAAFTDLAIMALQGVRKSRLELGEPTVVMGQGLMGICAMQFARLQGALPLIVSDLDSGRRQQALALGADHALDPTADDADAQIAELTGGRGAAVVIEVTGVAAAMRQALTWAGRLARVVALGCSREPTDGIDFYTTIHRPGVEIIGAHNSVRPKQDSYPGHWTAPDDRRAVLHMLAAGRLQVAPLISKRIQPHDCSEAYHRLAAGGLDALGVVFDWYQEH